MAACPSVTRLDRLYSFQDLSRWRGLGTGSSIELHIGFRNAQVFKELAGHADIVVLTGVEQVGLHVPLLAHGSDQRRDLDKIWPRSNDIQNFHGVHSSVSARRTRVCS